MASQSAPLQLSAAAIFFPTACFRLSFLDKKHVLLGCYLCCVLGSKPTVGLTLIFDKLESFEL